LKLSNRGRYIVLVSKICHELILQLHQSSIRMIIPTLKLALPKLQNNGIFHYDD
jgi:hypothetical protein